MPPFNAKTYWETRLKTHDGLMGVGYTRLGPSYNRWMYRSRRDVFLRETRAVVTDFSAAEALDIGSGTGFYIACWRELGVRRVTGLDLTAESVRQLQAQFPGTDFYELNIGAPDLGPLAGRQFDAISSMDVLFHIVDKDQYRQALANVYALLRPSGYWIFSDFLLRRAAASTQSHVALRTRAEVEAALRQAGFEIVRQRPLFVLMNQPIDAARPLQLLWKPLSALIALHEQPGLGHRRAAVPAGAAAGRAAGPGPQHQDCHLPPAWRITCDAQERHLL